VNDQALTLLHNLTVSIAHASIWCPSTTAAWERDRARRGLIVLDQNLLSEFPSEGLGCFILKRPTTQSHVAAAALPAIRDLESWIRTGSTSLPEKTVLELLGLGPGLTPSGDDFLAGTLCTLRAVGRADAADALWRLIEPASWVATVSISRAHLQSAARGHLAADLHSLLDALLAGAPGGICNGLGLLKKRDHSSPWDCLAGIAVSLRAVVAGNRGRDGSHSGNDPATSRFKHEADPSSEPRHSHVNVSRARADERDG
jgi:hypothetical protein